jgi:hypothetical protein
MDDSINEATFVNRRKYAVAIVCATAILFYASGVLAQQAVIACIGCHEFLGGQLAKPVTDWKGSVHQQNGITCDFCHGGNPNVVLGNVGQLSGAQFAEKKSQAMSAAHGFIAKPAGKAMFDLCRRCHGESVDRYEASIMGKAYLNSKGGPSCVACHHAHNNIIPDVPGVCKSCHKDTTGFDKIDPMNVTESTINQLSGIRIQLAEEKAKGARPGLAPAFPEDLGSYQIAFVAFGAVFVVFIIGYIIYLTLEKRD